MGNVNALINGQNISWAAGNVTTVDDPPLVVTQTWNAGGVTFGAIDVNITNTASASASTLLDLKVDGVSQLSVNKAGKLGIGGVDNDNHLYVYGDADATADTFGIRSTYNVDTPGTTETALHYAAVLSQLVIPAGNSTANPAWVAAEYPYFKHDGSANLPEANGVKAILALNSTGNVTNLYGFQSAPQLHSTAEVTTLRHFFAAPTTKEAGNTIGTEVGFYVGLFTSGTTKYAFYSAGPASHFAAADFDGNISLNGDAAVQADGTEAAPGFALAGNPNAGMFRAANNEIGFSTVGTKRFTIGGGVGIGASPPTAGLALDKTITAAATTGAQTINKAAGTVNFAAAATSLVVTNSLVDANSIIICTVATNDGTMKSALAVAGSGSFTIHANAAATAETRVNFLVVN